MNTAKNPPLPQTKPSLDADLVDLDHGLRIEGVDGVCCLVRHASPALRRCLVMLDGHHTLAALLRELSDDEQFSFRRLLSQLQGAGLLRQTSEPPVVRDVCLVGTSAVARLCATQLLREPGVRLRLAGIGGRGARPDAALALREWLVRSDVRLGRRIMLDESWDVFDQASVGLVVLASTTVQPDRALTAHLVRRSVPFLPVLAHRGWASVGPLADYRGGACLHCADLTRADTDQAWPAVLERLSHELAHPEPGMARLAASLAATHAAWFVAGTANPLPSITLELREQVPGLGRRRWRPHPDCACCWQAPVEQTLPGVGTQQWLAAA